MPALYMLQSFFMLQCFSIYAAATEWRTMRHHFLVSAARQRCNSLFWALAPEIPAVRPSLAIRFVLSAVIKTAGPCCFLPLTGSGFHRASRQEGKFVALLGRASHHVFFAAGVKTAGKWASVPCAKPQAPRCSLSRIRQQ